MTTVDPTPDLGDTATFPIDKVAGRADLDRVISELAAGELRWARLSLARRARLLGQVRVSVAASAGVWVQVASGRVKALPSGSQLEGEEWISGPYAVLSGLSTLQRSLRAIARGESPLERVRLGTAPGGRVTVPVLPNTPYEAVLFHGFSAEVWLAPGTTANAVRASAGLGALDPTTTGGIGLVLGAGNITSIPPLDVLYELIAHNRVVLLKLNPVMDALLPVYTRAFAPLITAGVLRIVVGGADVGGYLAHHAGVSHVHITGSSATHDVVVFGTGEEGARRKSAGEPLLDKDITSELGGVAPIIVIPGVWSRSDLRYQAEHVATQRLHNGGYNCIAGQIVVLSSEWPQREAFLTELRSALDRAPARPAWYPGSDARMSAAEAVYPRARRFGENGGRLLVDIGADDDASTIESTEYFSPVLGVVALPGTGLEFFETAVRTVNADFLGTLGANILVDPKTLRSLGSGFRECLATLRYGTIAVNTWTGVGFLSAAAPWGAFPGHELGDIQSGRGTVHNARLIDSPERTVVTGPFRPFPRSVLGGEFALFPKPPWFVTARSAAATGKLLTAFAARPSWLKLPAIFLSAFRA